MSEDFDVTQGIGDAFGRAKHRKLTIERCENGYMIDYETVKEQPDHEFDRTVKRRRVFITNSDLMEFIETYFSDEPRP